MEHPKLLAYCTPKNYGYTLENNTGFFFLGLSQSLLMIVIWLLTKNQKPNTKICCCLNQKDKSSSCLIFFRIEATTNQNK